MTSLHYISYFAILVACNLRLDYVDTPPSCATCNCCCSYDSSDLELRASEPSCLWKSVDGVEVRSSQMAEDLGFFSVSSFLFSLFPTLTNVFSNDFDDNVCAVIAFESVPELTLLIPVLPIQSLWHCYTPEINRSHSFDHRWRGPGTQCCRTKRRRRFSGQTGDFCKAEPGRDIYPGEPVKEILWLSIVSKRQMRWRRKSVR